MLAVVALPPIAGSDTVRWHQAVFRQVAGVPLLIRVLATAARSGVDAIILLYPPGLSPTWLRSKLQTPALAHLAMRLVESGSPGAALDDWQELSAVLPPSWVWLPWNLVTSSRTLSALITADAGLDMAPTGPAAADADGRSSRLVADMLTGPAMVETGALLEAYGGHLPAYLYDRTPTVAPPAAPRWVVVDSEQSTRAAEDLLLRGSGKSSDGIYSKFNRRLCRPTVRWLLRTPVTANMISVSAIPVVALAGYFYAQGYWGAYMAGALTHFVSVLMDEIDGMLARTTFTESAFGTWLDTMSDYLGYLALWVGMSVGLTRQYDNPAWLAVGGLTLVMSVLVFAVLVRQRRKLAHPNAFNGVLMASLEADAGNRLSRLIRLLAFLPKKAVMSHYVVWFTALGLMPLFVTLTAIGSVVTLMFVVYSNRFFRRPVPA